jgi:hypothetical protein
MVDARVSLNSYSNKVLMVVKAKYELNDKSEAINKFVEMYGQNEVEPEVKDSYVKGFLPLKKSISKNTVIGIQALRPFERKLKANKWFCSTTFLKS